MKAARWKEDTDGETSKSEDDSAGVIRKNPKEHQKKMSGLRTKLKKCSKME